MRTSKHQQKGEVALTLILVAAVAGFMFGHIAGYNSDKPAEQPEPTTAAQVAPASLEQPKAPEAPRHANRIHSR